MRKGWDSLAPGYRARLERGGVSRAGYERGESIKSARGHAKTPEHPKAYNPKEFPTYHNERQKLVKDINQKKQDFFGASPKWNPQKAKASLAKYAPPMALLRWAMDADYGEWIDAIHDEPETYAFLGYH